MPCRLFWSSDKRFLEQFKDGDITTKFSPFSKFPPVYKDIAFWITDQFTENNLAEIVRGSGAPRPPAACDHSRDRDLPVCVPGSLHCCLWVFLQCASVV